MLVDVAMIEMRFAFQVSRNPFAVSMCPNCNLMSANSTGEDHHLIR